MPSKAGCGYSAACISLCPRRARRLTLPSRGCPKGCAFCAPLMSNVRRREYAQCASPSHGRGFKQASPLLHTWALAPIRNQDPTLGRLQCFDPCGKNTNRVLALKREQEQMLVSQLGPQPYRASTAVAARKASVSLPRGLRLEFGMRSYCSSTATPNPSVEGMAKRLRLLSTPHLER